MSELLVQPFDLVDQPAAKALILQGLEEHWGELDRSLNPDLNDIASTYADGIFLCAWLDAELVGTGAIMPEREGVMRVMRMSVQRERRRMGIASRLLQALLDEARRRGCHTVVLETTETWADAIGFYLRHGFHIVEHRDGDAHFELRLAADQRG
jgi:GNAT superfamily N-acetyltransferase